MYHRSRYLVTLLLRKGPDGKPSYADTVDMFHDEYTVSTAFPCPRYFKARILAKTASGVISPRKFCLPQIITLINQSFMTLQSFPLSSVCEMYNKTYLD